MKEALHFFSFILIFTLTTNNVQAFDFHSGDKESPAATVEIDKPKKSLLDMLFGAFSKQQEEVDETDEIHLEDALRTKPDNFEPGTIANTIENLEGDFHNTSNFTILNTRTGKVSKHAVKVGEILEFEKIAIKNLSCWNKFEATILPESRSLVEIYNISNPSEISKQFYGWLLSSSQNSSLLENKEYDIILNSCSDK